MAPPAGGGGGLSFDDALVKYVGEFGRSQVRILLIASAFWVPNACIILLMVFATGADPVAHHDWACVDPTAGDPAVDPAACMSVYSSPEGPAAAGFCALPRTSWQWTHKSRSLVSQFDLVCGSAWKSQVVNSAFFLGYLIGSGTFGTMADAKGRKASLFLSSALAAASTALCAAIPNYWVYLLLRICAGVGAAGQALGAYLLATESVGPKWRGAAGVGTQLFFVFGEFLLVAVAAVFKPWRSLCLACAVLCGALLLLWPTLPESPRWLLAKGRCEEANAVLAAMAKENGTRTPPDPLTAASAPAPAPAAATANGASAAAAAEVEQTRLLGSGGATNGSSGSGSNDHSSCAAVVGDVEAASTAGAEATQHSKAVDEGAVAAAPSGAAGAAAAKPLTLGTMLKDRRILRRFLMLAYVWMVLCMTYYGISLALGGLAGSLYASFSVSAAAELPSNVLAAYLIERVGRHNTLAAGMLLAGAACLACAFSPAGLAQTVLAALGKFGCAGAFTIASIFTSELFPTLVRSAVLGAENEAARIGGIAAPFIVLLGTSLHHTALPFIVFGVTALVAGVLLFTLPETLGTALPDTKEDMDAILSIFTTRPWRKGGGWRATSSELFKTRSTTAASRQSMPPATIAEGDEGEEGVALTAAAGSSAGSGLGLRVEGSAASRTGRSGPGAGARDGMSAAAPTAATLLRREDEGVDGSPRTPSRSEGKGHAAFGTPHGSLKLLTIHDMFNT